MAPEIINGQKYNIKVDIWASGCIIYELCTLNFCFENDSINRLIKKIMEGNHKKRDKNFYGEDLQKLIDSLLNKIYAQIPTADDILKTINQNLSISFIEKIVGVFYRR